MNEEFVGWLNAQLNERGWSRSEAARRGKFSSSMMDKVIGGFSDPGLIFCQGVARAFNVSLEEVFRRAGILPPVGDLLPEVRSWSVRLMALEVGRRELTARAMDLVLVAVEESRR